MKYLNNVIISIILFVITTHLLCVSYSEAVEITTSETPIYTQTKLFELSDNSEEKIQVSDTKIINSINGFISTGNNQSIENDGDIIIQTGTVDSKVEITNIDSYQVVQHTDELVEEEMQTIEAEVDSKKKLPVKHVSIKTTMGQLNTVHQKVITGGNDAHANIGSVTVNTGDIHSLYVITNTSSATLKTSTNLFNRVSEKDSFMNNLGFFLPNLISLIPLKVSSQLENLL